MPQYKTLTSFNLSKIKNKLFLEIEIKTWLFIVLSSIEEIDSFFISKPMLRISGQLVAEM
jgi:hypothetical protein